MKGRLLQQKVHAAWLLLLVLVSLQCSIIFAEQQNGEDDDTYFNQFSVCADSTVAVADMSLYCDSPGSYYYGSNKYRNSASCQAGDKAKLQIQFQIIEELESDPYLSLDVRGYGTVEGVSVYSSESFCSSVSSSNGAVCPGVGYYYLKKQFFWGGQSDSYEYSFVPQLVVGIASDSSTGTYDLGGANTNNCNSGNTFSNWTVGVRKSAANTLTTFLITFGILVAATIAITMFTCCIMRQAQRYKYRKEKIVVVDEDNIIVNEHYYDKAASLVGKGKGFVVV